jgi:glycosyltransferase involved in cell wall biosynthesis
MKVSFIIPFHNEEKNILPMVKRVYNFTRSKKWQFEIIPVDDRSTDRSFEILKNLPKKYKNIFPIFRKKDNEEKGNTMGKALVIGTKRAKGDYIIWTMGDLADDIKTYSKIIEKLEDGYDMIFGSRYMPGGSRGNLDMIKAFLSSWGTVLARLLFGISVHDITNAFRGFRKNVFDSLILESAGFSISPEFAIKAHLAGFKLGEVPTVYTNRVEGVSSFKLYKMTKSYLEIYFQLFFRYLIIKKPYGFLVKKS